MYWLFGRKSLLSLSNKLSLTLQNNPETDLDLWHPTLGCGFHIQR
jgi:hypothetical protein